jgi:hypothetical protein
MRKADGPSLNSSQPTGQASNSQSLEAHLEGAILEYAINTFPFADSFDYFPGLENADFRKTLTEMINNGGLKVGFYYEEMQESLTLFYFLKVRNQAHIVLGLDPENIQVAINEDIDGVFRIDEEQYIELLQIPLN